jgi:hypothetical protein
MEDQEKSAVDPVENTETLQDNSAAPTTSTEESGNAEEKVASEAVETDSAKTKEAERREAGKLKQVQQQLEKVRSQYASVANWIASDRSRYKQALIETSGLTEAQAEQYATQAFPEAEKKAEGSTGVQQQPVQKQPFIDPIDQLADQESRARSREIVLERKNSIQEFVDNHIDLQQGDLNLVLSAAGRLEAKSKGSLRPKQALERAYNLIIDSDKLINKAREEGELQGLATASSVASSVSSSPSGTTTTQGDNDWSGIPDEERAEAQKFGFKASEYKIYRENPRVGV